MTPSNNTPRTLDEVAAVTIVVRYRPSVGPAARSVSDDEVRSLTQDAWSHFADDLLERDDVVGVDLHFEDMTTHGGPFETAEAPMGVHTIPLEQYPDAPAPTFPVGSRVRLTCDVDRYPHFIAPKGATGVVVDLGDPSIALAVRLDEPLEGAEDWNNEVHWYDADVESGSGPEHYLEVV